MAEMYCFSCRVIAKPRTRAIDLIAVTIAVVAIVGGIALCFVDRAPLTRRNPFVGGLLLAVVGVVFAATIRKLSSEFHCSNCDGINVGRLDSPAVQRELKNPPREG